MTKLRLLTQNDRLYFTLEEAAALLGLPIPSARVYLSRKVSAGDIVRLRRNLYVSSERARRLTERDYFALSNILQTPSYISYLSALSYHGLSSQWPQGLVEAASPVRSCRFTMPETRFEFHYCVPLRYCGYYKEKGVFIAEPEKALADSMYLASLGRYALDHSALDLSKLNQRQLLRWLRLFPPRVHAFFKTGLNHA
jgi:hypothetical protein